MAEVRKYDAFISYRHSELDKFVATTLQRKLEAFSLPKGVKSKTDKRRIERVFRDQDELPLSSNLSEPIHIALNNSDFLIVICTPRLPESKWCEEEISTFINLYGREKILAVLAEGEPEESFPPLLTGEDYEETLPDGSKVKKHRSFEPLAADVRGKSNKEIRKALDDAVLRIAASLFELNYDDLKQRHRERKIRRMFSIISSVAAAFMLFSAVCIGLMIKIMNQSNMIMEQNTAIKEQSNEISQKNALINQQYEEAARTLSKLTADNSTELLNKGRKLDALYMLRQVIPDSSTDTSKPYTPEAEAALVDALDVYSPVSELKFQNTYDSDYEIKSVCFSPDQFRMLTIDSGNNFKVFEVESGKILFSKQCICNSFDDSKIGSFCGNDYLIVSENDGIHKYSILDSKDIILDSPKNNGQPLKGKIFKSNNHVSDFSKFLVKDDDDIFLLDETGKSVFSFSISDYSNYPSSTYLNEYSISKDGKFMAFTLYNVKDDLAYIFVVSIDASETIYHSSYKAYTVNNIFFDEHNLYYTVPGSGLSNIEDDEDSYTCFSYDCDAKKMNWQSDKTDYSTMITVSKKNKYVYLAGYSFIISIDTQNGKIISTASIDEAITDIYSIANSDLIYIATESGNFYYYSCESNIFNLIKAINYYDDRTYSVKNSFINSNGYFVLYDNSNYLTRYDEGKSDHFKEYGEKLENLVQYNKSRDLYISLDSAGSYSVKSSETKETLFYIDNVSDFAFVGDGNQSVTYKSVDTLEMYVYDFVNDKTVALDNQIFKGNSPDRKYSLSVDLNNHYTLFDLASMQVATEFDILDDYPTTGHTYTPLDESHIMIKSLDNHYVDIFFIENNVAKKIFTKYMGKNDSFLPCSGINNFCIVYSTGMVEFYDYSTDKINLINTSFNFNIYFSDQSFEYFAEKEIYVLSSSSRSYIINKDLSIIASIKGKIYYMPTKNLITYNESNKIYAAPFYSYDELVKIADKELSGYCPPIRILKEYNITPN